MMNRQNASQNIKDYLALSQANLVLYQASTDYSLNMYSENFFRDIFNHVYSLKLENANYNQKNAPYIDLIDTENKCAYQITSDKSSNKIFHTLESLKIYTGYTVKIYYLLEKPNLSNTNIRRIKDEYNLNPDEILFNSKDLIRDIENLEETRLIELYQKYFKNILKDYSEEIVLNVVIQYLVREKIGGGYDLSEDFALIKPDEKIKVNDLSEMIKFRIREGIEFEGYILKIQENDPSTIDELRN